MRASIARVILGGQTYLAGKAVWLENLPVNGARWTKASGPGDVAFADAAAPVTTARFSVPGEYILSLTGSGNAEPSSSTLKVHVETAPPKDRLNVVYTTRYSVDSPLWSKRAKTLIVDWIPHCIAYCERTDIAPNRGDGGIDNFTEAGKANRGEPHARHRGYVFSNAWVHQTVESMCIALMVDAQGDPEILAAQTHMHDTLERWIPIILAAQMQDGYLQTAYILADRKEWPERWSPEHRGNHEGYVSGYFIESAINHYTLTDGKDLRLYNAAKRLADCWVANLGRGKKAWFDGHQEMEQALVRFGRFVNDQEGNRPRRCLHRAREVPARLASRRLGVRSEPSAAGAAVRSCRTRRARDLLLLRHGGYSRGDPGSRLPERRAVVVGQHGEQEVLPHRRYRQRRDLGGLWPQLLSCATTAYCESCSSCGLVFFQYKLNLAYHDAKYADLYEETMYNALLGGVSLEGNSFCYTNPLLNTERTVWHVCPCCVGNIPRTLLMMPTWAYVKSNTGVYVNLFIGSRIQVGKVAGTEVEMVQKTDYPWKGAVAITVNPRETKTFSVYVRIPNRSTSKLYSHSPELHGVKSFAVNGKQITPSIEKGYVVVTREWKAGDRIELDLPMEPQRVAADDRIKADLGTVAIKYGPLVYNVETADQKNIDQPLSDEPLRAEWRPEMLGGLVVVEGTWKDGSPMVAIPNYARMNRVGPPPEYPGDRHVNYAPGATTSSGAKLPSKAPTVAAPATPIILTPTGGSGNTAPADNRRYGRKAVVDSKVWI